jgi:transcriptional regulator with XRE-family HTH domain
VTLQEIGPFLRDARRRAKLSQEQLAQPLGMSRATISALESGRCEEIGFAKLAALFDSLGLEIRICRASHARPLMICALSAVREEATAPSLRQLGAHRVAHS